MPEKTDFAVYENRDHAYVMAYVCVFCTHPTPAVAFGEDARGLFAGRCTEGHDSTIMAS